MRYPPGSTPSYTPELAQKILDGLEACGSLRKVLMSEPGMPSRNTIERWITEDVDGFAARYARSKNLGLDSFVEETLEIADELPPLNNFGSTDTGAVAHAKLRIETRRWLAERMAPQRYGLKQGLELTGANGGPVQLDDTARAARVAQLMALAQQRKGEPPINPDDIA